MKSSTTTTLLAVAAAVRSVTANAQPPAAGKYLPLPLSRGDKLIAYYVDFEVGTPPQHERLLVDTGSPTYSFISPRNPYCARSDSPCKEFGTFNNLTSSTSKYAGAHFNDLLADQGQGIFLTDTITLAGVTIPDMYFGYVTDYPYPAQVEDPVSTVMGLALGCGGPNGCFDSGPAILPGLKNASAIDRMAASMYMGPDTYNVSNSLLILGGYYDAAKIGGRQFTIPMVDPNSNNADYGTDALNVTAIYATVNGTTLNQTYGNGAYDQGTPTVLDTGNGQWGIPPALFNLTLTAWGNPESSGNLNESGDLLTTVDCKYREPANSHGHITVEFGPAGSIEIPLHRLITQFPNGSCGTFVFAGASDGPNLGDPFIRNVYATWDAEAYTITLAPVKYTMESRIVPFPEGGFPLTSA